MEHTDKVIWFICLMWFESYLRNLDSNRVNSHSAIILSNNEGCCQTGEVSSGEQLRRLKKHYFAPLRLQWVQLVAWLNICMMAILNFLKKSVTKVCICFSLAQGRESPRICQSIHRILVFGCPTFCLIYISFMSKEWKKLY